MGSDTVMIRYGYRMNTLLIQKSILNLYQVAEGMSIHYLEARGHFVSWLRDLKDRRIKSGFELA
jgi:hypothetical protein